MESSGFSHDRLFIVGIMMGLVLPKLIIEIIMSTHWPILIFILIFLIPPLLSLGGYLLFDNIWIGRWASLPGILLFTASIMGAIYLEVTKVSWKFFTDQEALTGLIDFAIPALLFLLTPITFIYLFLDLERS